MNLTKPIITLCLAALLPMGAGAVTIRSDNGHKKT